VKILNISIYFKDDNNKGSAFLEFETPEIAKKILKEYNKKTIKGHLLKLNWTNLNQKNYNMRYSNNPPKNKYNDNTKENKVLYTVRN
jgi:RNA recognition motif-containing protein